MSLDRYPLGRPALLGAVTFALFIGSAVGALAGLWLSVQFALEQLARLAP